MPDKKNWIEIILMPTVIALVGIVGTATNVEEKNVEIKVAADRQVKLLEGILKQDHEQRRLREDSWIAFTKGYGYGLGL